MPRENLCAYTYIHWILPNFFNKGFAYPPCPVEIVKQMRGR